MKVNDQIIGKFAYHEQMNVIRKNADQLKDKFDKKDRKVLIIHTGGTIGSFQSSDGYKPIAGKFIEILKDYPYFCDSEQTFFQSQDNFLISPLSIYGKRIFFKLFEMEQVIDSSMMTVKYWNKLIQVLEKQYDNYDAFIITHGTDTLSYTASALSFMIQNLQKTIILTGAQIPMSQTRNDSIQNLLCSLVIAGHFTIPEVLVVFDNNLFRGNRIKKRSTSSLSAFDCPNFKRLGHFGLTIEIQWDLIIPTLRQFQNVKFIKFDKLVTSIKLSPLFVQIPRQKYVVIESYGCGNIPTQGPLYQWIKENSLLAEQQRQIIVNISQVQNSQVVATYQGGIQAIRLGVISGGDMTLEAAITKLSYLASKKYSYNEIRKKIGQNLRGEITEKSQQHSFINILNRTFDNKKQQYKKLIKEHIYPKLLLRKFDIAVLNKIIELGTDINSKDHQNKTILHHLALDQHFNNAQIFQMLLKLNFDFNATDDEGNSPFYYLIIQKKKKLCQLLFQKGLKIITNYKSVFNLVKQGKIQQLSLLKQYGNTLEYELPDGKNLGMYALLLKNTKVIDFFKKNTDLLNPKNQKKDLYGKTIENYINYYNQNQNESQQSG